MSAIGDRLFALLLYLYPRAFRQRYAGDLMAFFRHDREHPRYGSGPLRPLRFWAATLRDLVRAAWSHRMGRSDAPPAAPAGHPPGRRVGWSRLGADVRHAWRGLRATPGITASALAVLTLGIGTGTAIFSVVDAVALRGLPFADADRLVAVQEVYLADNDPNPVAWPNYADWRLRQQVFEVMGASARMGRVTTTGDGPVDNLTPLRVTASLFDVLRVAPVLGRRFQASDERPGAPAVAIISDRLWRRRFGARPDIVGQVMTFENGSREIIGVLPAGFVYPLGSVIVSQIDFWVPFVATPRETARDGGRTYSLTVVARLAPGVSVEQAHAQMTQVRDGLAAEYPRWFTDMGVVVRPMRDAIVNDAVRAWMLLLLIAVGGVLLVACLNVANLLLARALSRGREVALRSALGASRWDLARGLIVESLMLSLAGAVCGVIVAFWAVDVLRATLPDNLPRVSDIAVDLRVLGVTGIVAVATGLVFGTLPALPFSKADVAGLLRHGGRGQTGAGAGRRLRMTLVVAEVAVAVVLLAGAALFATSFARVLSVDLGLNPAHLLAIAVSPRVGGSPAATLVAGRPQDPTGAREAQLRASQSAIVQALGFVRAVPGVVGVTAISGGLPLSGNSMTVPVRIARRDAPPFEGDDEAFVHGAMPDYLQVMGATLERGRWISDADVREAPGVTVLSDEAVRRYFGGADPLGQTVLLDQTPRTVVGVVRGIRHGGPESPARPQAFVPFLQHDQPAGDVVVRSAADQATLVPQVQQAIRTAIPTALLYDPQTMAQHFGRLVAQRRFNMVVIGLFGALALLIAGVGIYGLMAFLVAQRTREIGVRLSLGAAPGGVLRMVLAGALRLMAIGLVVGLAMAAGVEQLVRAFLYQARPHDPMVYLGVAIVLTSVGLLAAFGPARRASRVDPMITLRAE